LADSCPAEGAGRTAQKREKQALAAQFERQNSASNYLTFYIFIIIEIFN
jgi:hypothetical protein